MQITTQIFNSLDDFKSLDTRADLFLSVSKAKTFDSCKAKYKYQYIEKLPKKSWDFLIFGKFVHFVLERFHEELLTNPEKKDQWEDVLKASWKEGVKEYSNSLTVDQKLEAGPIIKEYRDLLVENGLPNVIGVEKDFNITVTDGDKLVLLNGFIDRLEIDKDEVLHVSDYKTSKNLKYLREDFFQLETYAFVLMQENPDIDKIRASYIGLRHNFKYITKEFTRDEILNKVGEKFISYASDIMKEKMWRPSPTFLCSYCDYLDSCKAGERFLIKKGKIKTSQNVGKSAW